MFKPSQQTAEQVVQSLQPPPPALPGFDLVKPLALSVLADAADAADAAVPSPTPVRQEYRPDAHSHNAPTPGSPISLVDVQSAMSEELSRFLGTLMLWYGTVRPNTRLPVMGQDRKFTHELAATLAPRLGISGPSQKAVAAFERFSNEFYEWVVGNPADARQQGLEVKPDGTIVLNCRAAKAVLKPLDK